MNSTSSDKPVALQLIPLEAAHSEAFYDLVNVDEVRSFFEHFCAAKEEILARMPDVAEDLTEQEYWLVKQGQTIVAYATIKKNTGIYDAIHPPAPFDPDDPDFLASFDRTPEEQEAIDQALALEKKNAAPYAVDIIVHRDHRKQGLAFRSFELLAELAKTRGAEEVYLEVHRDNAASRKLVEKLRSKWVLTNDRIYYPSSIYQYPIKFLKTERQFQSFWRELLSFVPELKPHRELLREWFYSMSTAHVDKRFAKDTTLCKLGQELQYQNRMFYLQIGVAKRDDPLTLIWSLFHEYGHFCQDEPTEAEKKDHTQEKYDREADAWRIAEEKLRAESFYQDNKRSFELYRDEALKSYLVQP
jgi:ribosomal protein S18 acetylase RimI-like enzyme